MKKTASRKRQTQDAQQGVNQIFPWATLLGLMILILLFMGLWYRWLRPDPDFLAFTSNMAGILTIATFLGLQTTKGKTLIVNVEEGLGKGVLRSPITRLVTVWGLVLIAALGLWVGSPLAAESYRTRGVAFSESGNHSAAVRAFQQAISLDPQSARSHYDLAVAWEALFEYEGAIREYKIALEMDAAFWPAYNNLGRLLLFQRGDAEAALSVLIAGQQRADSPLGQAVIHKNLAWAYVEVGLSATALQTIEESIRSLLALRDQGENTEIYLADAHRLRARILDSQPDRDEAWIAWQDSLGYSLALIESQDCRSEAPVFPQYCSDAIQWAAEAREALLNLEKDQDGN